MPADAPPPARPPLLRASHSIYALQAPGIRRYWRFANDVFVESARDDLALLSAALAHYTLLTIIPVLLLAASFFGTYLKSERAQQQAIEMIGQYIPAVKTELAESAADGHVMSRDEQVISGVFQRMVKDRGTAGGIGLLALLWICLRIFTTLQRALDNIWKIEHSLKRPFYWQYPIALLTIVFVGLFAWFSMAVTSLISSLRFDWLQAVFGDEFRLPDFVTPLSVLVSMLLSVLLMFMIYRWLPSARVRSRSAIYGAVVAGLLWEVSKHLFTWYVTNKAHYDRFYGTMGSIVIVMLWSYLSAYILFLGAEVVYCHAKWIAAAPVLEAGAESLEPGHALADLAGQSARSERLQAAKDKVEP